MLKPLEAKCVTTFHMIQSGGGGGRVGNIHIHREKVNAAKHSQLFHLSGGCTSGYMFIEQFSRFCGFK